MLKPSSDKKRIKQLAGIIKEDTVEEFFEENTKEFIVKWFCNNKNFKEETFSSKEEALKKFKENPICQDYPNKEHFKLLQVNHYIVKGYGDETKKVSSEILKDKEYNKS